MSLPHDVAQFRSKEYWDKFFRDRKQVAFEWYGEYKQLKAHLKHYVGKEASVLVVGCGNSSLSGDMFDDGFSNITSMDFSELVIDEMRQKNRRRAALKWDVMDMMNMSYADGSFDVVLDKGALDAMASDDTDAVAQDVVKIFSEFARVLRVGGHYVCVSLAQDHVLAKLLHFFGSTGWAIEVHHIELEDLVGGKKAALQPFFFNLCKLADATAPSTIRISFADGTVNARDLSSVPLKEVTVAEIQARILEIQWIGANKSDLGHITPGKRVFLDLSGETAAAVESAVPRFSITVLDSHVASRTGGCAGGGRCAAFVIPQGREREWIFSSEEGQLQLAEKTGYQRLILIQLNHGHEFTDMESVKNELSGKVVQLTPANFTEKIPFLTIGEGGVGKRKVVHSGTSEFSGPYVVEDVESDGEHIRQLVFLNNTNVVQSEVPLVPKLSTPAEPKKLTKNQRRKLAQQQVPSSEASNGEATPPPASPELVPSFDSLTFEHHRAIVAGLTLVLPLFQRADEQPVRTIVVGLGGGVFPMFLYRHFPRVYLRVVELDPAILTIATDFFGFVQDERMIVHIGDGLEYIRNLATTLAATPDSTQLADIIVLDVDSKDVSVGMSCPPAAFVESSFLQSIKQSLVPEGVLILNLVARSDSLYKQTIDTIKAVFAQVLELGTDEDVNRIIFAFPTHTRRPTTSAQIVDIGRVLVTSSCTSPASAQVVRPLFADRSVIEPPLLRSSSSSTSTTTSSSSSAAATKSAKKKKKRR